ncbi:MAG: metal-dependent hydrolase [Kiritimatiellota bacterium]|nr:metal-dependent hydrolase [Kiritimatiellota bacterium]
MSSPIAHSLIGLALGLIRFLPRYQRWDELAGQLRALGRPLLFCVLLANAPDLDYFLGIFRGNLNYYHQTVTHTLVWVGLTALAIWAYGRFRERRAVCWPIGLLLALLGSHLLADWLTVDRSPPIGLMLAWPFSDHLYHAAFAFFPPPAKQIWADLWSLQNLRLVLVETAITLPLVIIVLWFKRRQTKR